MLISFSEATRKQFMVATSRAWYNCSYTMAAKPIKTLYLHYTMIQFLIGYLSSVRNMNTKDGCIRTEMESGCEINSLMNQLLF